MNEKSRPHKVRQGPSSFGVTGLEMEARRAGRMSTIEVLKSERLPLAVVQIPENACETAERSLTEAMSTNPPDAPSACQTGCAWCCYKTVGTAAPEVFRIVDYLQRNLSPEALQAALDRVILLDEERRSAGRRPRPCPLLENNQCIAYPVRPLTCRGYNSSDAKKCELSLDPRNKVAVPAYWPQQRLFTLVLDGVRSGLSESGLPGELLELTRALRIAMTVPEAHAQWLGGKDVFAGAKLN